MLFKIYGNNVLHNIKKLFDNIKQYSSEKSQNSYYSYPQPCHRNLIESYNLYCVFNKICGQVVVVVAVF